MEFSTNQRQSSVTTPDEKSSKSGTSVLKLAPLLAGLVMPSTGCAVRTLGEFAVKDAQGKVIETHEVRGRKNYGVVYNGVSASGHPVSIMAIPERQSIGEVQRVVTSNGKEGNKFKAAKE